MELEAKCSAGQARLGRRVGTAAPSISTLIGRDVQVSQQYKRIGTKCIACIREYGQSKMCLIVKGIKRYFKERFFLHTLPKES